MNEWIGQVMQRPDFPMKLNTRIKVLEGFLYTKNLGDSPLETQHGMYLIAQNGSEYPKIFCKVTQIDSYKEVKSTYESSISGLTAIVALEPQYEISDGYEGELRTQCLEGFKLRFPNDEEFGIIYRIPKEGLHLGNWRISHSKCLEYKYPIEKIYKSMFVSGVQGTGKTNFLKFLVKTLSSSIYENKPAIVIVDVEGEYSKSIEKLENVEKYVVSPGNDIGNVTLSISEIAPEDLQYFMPEMESKTSELMDKIVKNCYEHLEKTYGRFTKEQLLTTIGYQVRTDMLFHPAQRPAILRALETNNFDLFNQAGKEILTADKLLIPNKINIIDLSSLEHDSQQRAAALYLLTMFHRYKLKSNNKINLALIIDESHRLFPRVASYELRREYMLRIAHKISEITHRGRKRNYGIVFATQSPSDITPTIIELCDTKVCFRLSGHKQWIQQFLGKEYCKELDELETGTAIISCKGVHEPVKIEIPLMT